MRRPFAPASGDNVLHDAAPGNAEAGLDSATIMYRPASVITHADVPPRSAAPLPTIEGYQVLDELGRGGMGVVYQARQVGLNRLVAIKMILAGSHAGADEIARFRAEAESVARLQHANIVQIYEIGEHEGRPYFALEFVDGGTLSQKLAGVPLSANEAAALADSLARAMQYAHEHGVVHRDLKPANVLLQQNRTEGNEGNEESHQRRSHARSSAPKTSSFPSLPSVPTISPKITDFGLAKQLDTDTSQTQSGAIMGTPSYMAPEQAAGLSKDIGPAADIYSLGAILYEMLVGRPPFRAATLLETLEQVRSQEPVAPTRLQPGLPRDLETICLKCLQKEPAKRYESAAALADDLARFLGGEPIDARPVSRAERAWRWAKRKPVLAGLSATVAVLLLAATIVPSVMSFYLNTARLEAKKNARDATDNFNVAEKERQEAVKQTGIAKEQKDRAESSEKLARRHLYAARMNLAEQAVAAGNLARALELLESVRPKFDEDDLRGFEWYHLWQVCHRGERFVVDGLGGRVLCVAFSPDGRSVFASARGVITVCDASTGERRATARAAEYDVSMALSPDGKTLVTGDGAMWDADTLTPRTADATRVASMKEGAFSQDGRLLVGLHWNLSGPSLLKMYDANSGEERATLEHDRLALNKIAFSPTGEFIAAGAGDSTVRVWNWDGSQGKPHAKLAVEGWGVPVAFSPDGKKLATGGRIARVWDVATSSELKRLPGQTGEVYAVAFAPDGNTVALGGKDRTVTIWDSASGAVQIVPHRGAVHSVAFSPDGSLLASGGEDQSLRLWNMNRPPEPTVLPHPSASSVAISADRRTIATGSWDRTVKLWDAESGRELATLSGHTGLVRAVALSPDGRLLATGGDDAMIRLWDVETRQLLRSLLQGKQKQVWCLAFSPDGETLATGGIKDVDASENPGELKLWDVATGEERFTFQGDCFWVGGLSFSPDGKLLATGHILGGVNLWNVATGRLASMVQNRTGDTHWTWTVAFSPDGKMLATGDSEGIVRLRDVSTSRLLSTLKGPTAAIKSLAFFPDRRTLAAGGGDGTVKLWDIETGQERITLKGHAGEVGVAIASDGNTMATAGKDGLVKLWHASIQPAALASKDELDPDDPDTPFAHLRAAYRDHPEGRYTDSEKSFRAAIARFDQLTAAFPNRHEYRSELADAHQSLAATLQVGFKRVEEAEQELQLAQALFEKLVAELPSETRFRSMLAYCHRNRMAALNLLGRSDEAEQQFRKAREQYEQLVGEFPNVGEYQRRLVDLAAMQSACGKQDAAEQIYQRLLELSPDNPTSLNNLAWMMVSNSDAKLRDPARAIEIAKRAVELAAQGSQAGYYWNTLGVAHYRAGEWSAAIDALERAMSLRSGGDSVDWFVLAMAYHQQGDKIDARYWYGSAVEWMTANKPKDEELIRFRTEARSVIGDTVDEPLANAEQSSAGWWLEQGTRYATEDAWDKAAVRFSRAIELDRKDVRAWQGRGNAHAKLGRWDQALTDFTAATALAPNDATLWRARAEVQLARGQSPISDYSKALAIKPADWQMLVARGEAYRQVGQHDQALSDYDAALAIEPSDAALLIARARLLVALQQWEKADAAWTAVIELAPDHGSAWFQRGAARHKLSRWEPAAADFEHAAELGELGPADMRWLSSAAHRTAGDLQRTRGDLALAEKSFAKSVEICEQLIGELPAYAWSYNELGLTLEHRARLFESQQRQSEADTDRARTRVERIRWLDAGYNDNHLRGIYCSHIFNQMPAGEAVFWAEVARHAVTLWPADAATWTALGVVESSLGHWSDSKAAFDKSLELRPAGDSPTWFYSAMTRWKLDDKELANQHYDRGVKWLEQSAADASKFASHHRIRKQASTLLGKTLDDLDRAIAMNRADAVSLFARARHLFGLKQYDKALTDYSEVLKLKPDDAAAWSARADLHFYQLRQYDKAIADYSEVIRLQPSIPQPFGRRGRAYMVLSQWDKATADINHAIELNSPVGETWYFYVLLRLHSGQTDDYGKLCTSLVDRFGQAKDATTAASIARACSLAPSGLADPTHAVRFAELALATDPKSAFFLHNLGLAHHRAGQYNEAIGRFNESLAITPKWVDPLNWLGLALAHHGLGQPDAAREWFTKADQWLDTNNKELSKSPAGTPPPHNYLWLEIQLLHREAKALLTTKPPQ